MRNNHSRPIELLAPAKDLPCGIEAVNHGADAVYIGAPRFGARAAAGNTLEDIQKLCDYAHLYYVRVYVALNTIIREEELPEVEQLIWQLYGIGVDALIIQDMGITQLDIPPIPLHASTQTDNRTPEKVKFLEANGFSQVVLARELSLNEIRTIADQVTVPLEVFIHGALCVSYSGQCYLSAGISARSANRGECGQYCRLPYSLLNADGKEIIARKHLLSLRDMNRTDFLEDLLDAGVTSFKIEGRLKDVGYVKNITAWYRKQLDVIFKKRTEYHQASHGHVALCFEPNPEKSFNRRFTPFFLKGRTPDITSFDTPKSVGEPVGTVKEIKGNSFTVAGMYTVLNNGDGLVYFNKKGELEGFRVNRVEDNRIFPLSMPGLEKKTLLYRNYDNEFDKRLSQETSQRKVSVHLSLTENKFGFTLSLRDDTGILADITESIEKEPARRDQAENIRTQLGKLGNTIFHPQQIEITLSRNWFIPSSVLSGMRRRGIEALLSARKIKYPREIRKQTTEGYPYPENQLTYLGNVANSRATDFYLKRGVEKVDPAFEIKPVSGQPLMFARHCIRYSMGWCPIWHKEKSPYREPFILQYKQTRLKLAFDCKNCLMTVNME